MIEINKFDVFYLSVNVFMGVFCATMFWINIYQGEKALALADATFVLLSSFMFCIDAHAITAFSDDAVRDLFNYHVF